MTENELGKAWFQTAKKTMAIPAIIPSVIIISIAMLLNVSFTNSTFLSVLVMSKVLQLRIYSGKKTLSFRSA